MKPFKTANTFRWIIVSIWVGLLISGAAIPGAAQTVATPTPNSDGVILIEVQPNDTLWGIAGSVGLSLDELLQLNNLTEDSVLQPGQLLIIGIATPTPTSTAVPPTLIPSPTLPPPPTPTAVSQQPTGLCLTAFEDIDGDGERHPGEPLLPNVAFTVYNEQIVVFNYITDGLTEPACFDAMLPGPYQVTRSFGAGERLTTPGNRGVIVQEGAVADLQFGSTFDASVEIRSDVAPTPSLATPLPLGAVDGAEAAVDPTRNILIALLALGVLLVLSLFFIILQLRARQNPPRR